MICGLDISTSITGITILDDNLNIVFCDHVDFRKEKNLFNKAILMEETIASISYRFDITQVYIEQPFTFFKSGGSSGKTMAILQKFNGIVSWQCFKIFGREPKYLTAAESRKLAGISIPRGQKAKEVVMKYILDNVPAFDVEYTRHGNPKPGYADRADSYVIAKAGLINEQQQKA